MTLYCFYKCHQCIDGPAHDTQTLFQFWYIVKMDVALYFDLVWYKSKKEDKDQESIQSSTTPDPDTNVKVATPQLDITNESQEVSR